MTWMLRLGTALGALAVINHGWPRPEGRAPYWRGTTAALTYEFYLH